MLDSVPVPRCLRPEPEFRRDVGRIEKSREQINRYASVVTVDLRDNEHLGAADFRRVRSHLS